VGLYVFKCSPSCNKINVILTLNENNITYLERVNATYLILFG
jgi:predicted nucleic acid-binding Zn ribbon protein